MLVEILLYDLKIDIFKLKKLYNDNKAAMYIANNIVFYERTKHIEVDYHFLRDKIQSNVISIEHLQSKWQPVDLLTKAISRDTITRLNSKLGLYKNRSNLRGRM